MSARVHRMVAIGSPLHRTSFREVLENAIRRLRTAGRVRVGFPKVRAEPTTDVEEFTCS